MFVKNMKKILKLERNREQNFREIIVKYEKNLNFLRKLYKKSETFRVSRTKIAGNWKQIIKNLIKIKSN